MTKPHNPVPVQSPERALQCELALFDEVACGRHQNAIHMWRSEPGLVVPRHFARLPGFASACDDLQNQGWPVVCRATGGDAVPQTAGMLNIALAFVLPCPAGNNNMMAYAYEQLCHPIIAELKALGLTRIGLGAVSGAFCDGSYNITIDGRKVVGTAQRWRQLHQPEDKDKRFAVLAHAAIIVDADLARLVDMTNCFYRLCGIDRQCLVASHSTVVQSLRHCELILPEDLFQRLTEGLFSAYTRAKDARPHK